MNTSDFSPQNRAAPALWNPSAAASWSLLFSGVFGATLHALNWHALGAPRRAALAWFWVALGVGLAVLGWAMGERAAAEGKPVNAIGPLLLVHLLLWYFLAAKGQIAAVREGFGVDYPRQGWVQPLVLALVLAAVSGVVVFRLKGEPLTALEKYSNCMTAVSNNAKSDEAAKAGTYACGKRYEIDDAREESAKKEK